MGGEPARPPLYAPLTSRHQDNIPSSLASSCDYGAHRTSIRIALPAAELSFLIAVNLVMADRAHGDQIASGIVPTFGVVKFVM